MTHRRIHQALRLAFHLALSVLPAPGVLAYTAHYFVISENSDTGELAVVYHRLVELAGLPEGSAMQARQSTHESRLQTRVLDKSTGIARFETIVTGSPWLRAEFHGTNTIDGQIFPVDQRLYVVRVPVEAFALLELEGLDASVASPSLAQPSRLLIDLDEAKSVAAAVAPPPQALPAGWVSGSLAETGSPSNRLDVLIVAEGYTAAQQQKFITDATTVSNNFFNESPYSVFKQLVNVSYLFVPSTEEGADHPACPDPGRPVGPVYVRNTAFDATYCFNSSWRTVVVNQNKLLAAAANVADWDKLLVLVNDPEYGGSGGLVAVASTHALAVEIIRHEFGHQFTLLDDEYGDFVNYPACTDKGGGPACGANTTDVTTRGAIKWLGWIAGTTATPTIGQLADEVATGLWEGARYKATGMYRQCFNGKMRQLSRPYCHVDSEAFVKRLYGGWSGVPAGGVSNIEPGATPASATVNAAVNSNVNFSATIAGSSPAGALAYSWLVDNQISKSGSDTHGSVQTFTYKIPDTTPHIVTLRVTDTTPLLLQPNVRTQSWSVSGAATIPNITLDITGDGNPDALSDGLLVLRYLFQITGNALTSNALGNNPVRGDASTILTYLTAIKTQLDVDGNGEYDALTDGLLIIRYMFGLRGDALIAAAVSPNATRKTAALIEPFIVNLLAPK